MTYRQFLSDAEQIARRLIGQGCRHSDVTAISAPNSIDWLIFAAAVMRIGAVPATINSLLTVSQYGNNPLLLTQILRLIDYLRLMVPLSCKLEYE